MHADFREIPIESVRVGKRIREDVGDLEALARSIERLGLLQPIVVGPEMVLAAGYRRLLACRLLGWTTIPARVWDGGGASAEIAENANRKDFEPLEVGAFVDEHWDEVASSTRGRDTRDVFAELFGCSGPHIDRCRRLYRRVAEGADRAEVERVIDQQGVAAADAVLSLPERNGPSGGVVSTGRLSDRPIGVLACVCRTEAQAQACVQEADGFPLSIVVLPNGPCIASLPKPKSRFARLCVLMNGHSVRFAAVYGDVPDERDRLVFGGHDWGDSLGKAIRYYGKAFDAVYDPFSTEAGFWAAAGCQYWGECADDGAVEAAKKKGVEVR